jgi:acetyl esterase/lipase
MLPGRRIIQFLLISGLSAAVWAAEMRLWNGDAPGAFGHEPQDIPTLTPYLVSGATKPTAAMVICPGGGYQILAAHEGEGYALWLNRLGISAFVLKYRLGSASYRHPVMMQDATRAIRLVRAKSEDWNVDFKRVGLMGSSAGGHLASTLLTHFDTGNPLSNDPVEWESCRPDLGVLCYPVITMGTNTHAASREMLLGTSPAPGWLELLSNEKQVTRNTPPCFLWHFWEDTAVKVSNSQNFALALRRHRVPVVLQLYHQRPEDKINHGNGLGEGAYNPQTHTLDWNKLHPWTQDCFRWLKERRFISSDAKWPEPPKSLPTKESASPNS